MSMPKGLHIGVAGWSYPQWEGLVYERGHSKGTHALQQIARMVDAVEINTSFYQPLKAEVTRLWMRRVEANEAFRFTAKMHQQFTHQRRVEPGEVAIFKQGLLPLLKARKLGAVLMQFPWSFRFTRENREFFIELRRAFHEFPLVAEMRHDSWISEEAIGTFLDYHVGFCNLDQPAWTRATPPTSYLTSRIGYVRLHGRNPLNSLGNFEPGAARGRQHDYLYTLEELAAWKQRIDRVHRFADATFVIFNNDASAKSVVNALEMEGLFGRPNCQAPGELIRRYPAALAGCARKGSYQPSLFEAA